MKGMNRVSGRVLYHSMYLMEIPASNGRFEVFIEVDVVKKTDTHIDF